MKRPVARSSSAPNQFHAVRFYESERSLARIVAEFLAEGFPQGHPGIVVATASQRAAIIRELAAKSFDIIQLKRSRDLLFLDAKEMLSTFMTDGGVPDQFKFNDQMCEVIDQVCCGRSNCKVRIFGQMVDVLWREGQRDAAIRLEILWNQLAHKHAFSLLCGYAMGNFYKDANFDDICGQHSHIVSADGRRTQLSAP